MTEDSGVGSQPVSHRDPQTPASLHWDSLGKQDRPGGSWHLPWCWCQVWEWWDTLPDPCCELEGDITSPLSIISACS